MTPKEKGTPKDKITSKGRKNSKKGEDSWREKGLPNKGGWTPIQKKV